MTEKVEWEVVEDPAPENGRTHNPRGARPAGAAAQAMLGPWWRWKLAALFTLGTIALVLVLAVAGVLAVAIAATALVSFGIARLVYWLRGKHGGALARRGYGPSSR